METLGNIYGNRSRHVTRRVKLKETLNYESLFIPSRLGSYWSMNSLVAMNPHGSVEKVKLLLNISHLEPQAVKPPHHLEKHQASLHGTSNVKVVLRHYHRSRYRSSPLWFFCGEGL
jgi:hypothetical protein